MPTYTLFAMIGTIFAVVCLFVRMEEYNIYFHDLMLYLVISILGLLLAARLLFAIAMIPSMERITLQNFLYYLIHGGIVFYGGLLGLLGSVALVAKMKGDELNHVYNYIAPAIPLFHAWARIGCLFAGCCYGREWNWGVVMVATPEIIRFPVQIVESVCNVLIFFTLLAYEKHHKGEKHSMVVYLVLYAVCRFFLEFFRGDTERGIWGYLSTAQIISIGIMVFLVLRDCVLRTKKKRGAEFGTT